MKTNKQHELSGIKKLASQTMWYGVSSIAARFLNYLLTPYLTYKLTGPGYGEMSLVYAAIPFLNVIFTYGLETAYFRFASRDKDRADIYSTSVISLIGTTVFLSGVLVLFRGALADVLKLNDHPEFITYSIIIIAIDTLTTLPFAKLRQQGRPRKYAMVRIVSILINIGLTVFFISVCPRLISANPAGFIAQHYIPDYGVGYVILANLFASLATWLMLAPEFFAFKLTFNSKLWKEMMVYSLPLLIAGFGGMINEVFDRIMLGWWAPVSGIQAAKNEVGIYSACYKLSILISLFIQAFRMGAEPFFFKQAEGKDPHNTYARVMKFFVITITIMFLVVALYLDVWKEFIRNKSFWVGLPVVPILLLANMFLGIYYNLSIWYKITHKTTAGATITIVGVVITLLINYYFIPHYSYMACAWATFFCYGSMMVVSYIWGQKYYHVPYQWAKLSGYMVLVTALYLVHHFITSYNHSTTLSLSLATIFLVGYCLFILSKEKDEFRKIPLLAKYFH